MSMKGTTMANCGAGGWGRWVEGVEGDLGCT